MSQVIFVGKNKKISIYEVSQPINEMVKDLEKREWNVPAELKEMFEPSSMNLVETRNSLIILPNDYSFEIELIPNKEGISLTHRQKQVLDLIAEGDTTRSMSYKLNISERTILSHVQGLKERLGAYSRAHCVLRATELGLLSN